jgi:soluble lytic murein transglycosylase
MALWALSRRAARACQSSGADIILPKFISPATTWSSMRPFLLLTGMALALGACARGSPPPIETGPHPAMSAATHSATTAPAVPRDTSWVEAMRSHRWELAAELIDGLDAAARAEPATRYARARAALRLEDYPRALEELRGLEQKLPLLDSDIKAHRADCQLEVGPYEEAARYFVERGDATSLGRAARAFDRAGNHDKALATVERALRAVAKMKGDRAALEAELRAVRAQAAEHAGKKALMLADLRWIAMSAPVSPHADGVDEKLASVEPRFALTRQERLERAMTLAKAGRVDRTERELQLLEAAAGPPVRPGDVLHARGWALYAARSDYARASELLEQAARAGSRDPVHDLFHAARARSRANQDEAAIAMYEELARRYPKNFYAEQARYMAARLRFILGQWDEAARAYASYLVRYGMNGPSSEAASYELAIAKLAGKKDADAAVALGKLADAAEKERDRPLEATFLRELQAVALANAGRRAEAVARFRSIAGEEPLSFAALASAARLRALGEPAPPLIAPAPSAGLPPPLTLRVPAKAQLLLALGLDGDAERELEAAEPVLRKTYGTRGDEALCMTYGKLATAGRRYRIGQGAVRASALDVAPSAVTRWAWECIYPRPYPSLIAGLEREYELPSDLVYSVMRQESAFSPRALSPAGASGLMQLIEPTARRVAAELSVDEDGAAMRDPVLNMRFGAYYLAKLLDMFGDRVELAAAAYNAGPPAVSRWLESGEALPLDVFVARIPYKETRGYVQRVVGNMARYAYLRGGDGAVRQLELNLPRGLRAPPDAY